MKKLFDDKISLPFVITRKETTEIKIMEIFRKYISDTQRSCMQLLMKCTMNHKVRFSTMIVLNAHII